MGGWKLQQREKGMDVKPRGNATYEHGVSKVDGSYIAMSMTYTVQVVEDVDLGGLPLFFFSLDSPPSPSPPLVAAPASTSGLGFLGGRPRFLLGAGSPSAPSSSGFFSWGNEKRMNGSIRLNGIIMSENHGNANLPWVVYRVFS